MKLLIAIPALNEEESIESICQRSLSARRYIIANSPVKEVEITVVSDGSTDRTAELARRFSDINLIVFEQNRGYGAAIKEAWARSDADFLGFLDADGTCDPSFFAELSVTLVAEDADVVLGCRLNKHSKMPLIRRVGNFVFATMLTVFSSTRVRDTASGMRVIRRTSLPKLMPLPDGLHFTPAMSARAMLSSDLRIVEIDMPYQEREGESKLRLIKDGLRFLKVIVEAAFLYRPARPLSLLSVAFLAAATLLMGTPILHYVAYRSVTEWMIYRFIVSHLLATSGILLFAASFLSATVVKISLPSETARSADLASNVGEKFFNGRYFWSVPTVLLLVGAALVFPSFRELIRTGATYEHWSRYIVMSFLGSAALILLVTKAVGYVLSLVASRLAYLESTHVTVSPAAMSRY